VGQVIIGMDPHKRSATIEVINDREKVLALDPCTEAHRSRSQCWHRGCGRSSYERTSRLLAMGSM